MRVGTVEFGEGKLVVAACLLAVLLSFLPTSTSQFGPPDLIKREIKMLKIKTGLC